MKVLKVQQGSGGLADQVSRVLGFRGLGLTGFAVDTCTCFI